MKKVYVDGFGKLILPKKYINVYPLIITTTWAKTIIYHKKGKKGSFDKSEVIYFNTKNTPYVKEGLIKINDDIYQLKFLKYGKIKKGRFNGRR